METLKETMSTEMNNGNTNNISKVNNIQMIKVELMDNWIVDCMDIWDYSDTRKYKNYLGKVGKDNDGNDIVHWLSESYDPDAFFNVSSVNAGDILLGGCKNLRKHYSKYKTYYYVVEKTNDSITLIPETTYLKVKKKGALYEQELLLSKDGNTES